ncbi:hypothetical protein GQ56_0124830 [Burkholderia paludis]|nr:hypothetical protein GQ56_0124830 [Burkholderia paludis]
MALEISGRELKIRMFMFIFRYSFGVDAVAPWVVLVSGRNMTFVRRLRGQWPVSINYYLND